MTALRWVGLSLLLVAVLAALVPVLGFAGPNEVAVQGKPVAAAATSVAMKKAEDQAAQARPTKAKAPAKKAQPKKTQPEKTSEPKAEDGPVIDPETSERANSDKQRRKLVVGGIALGLGIVVVFGRRARSKRRAKVNAHTKGK